MTSWFMKNNNIGGSDNSDKPQDTSMSALDRQLQQSNNRRFNRNRDNNDNRNNRNNRNTSIPTESRCDVCYACYGL